MPPPELPPGITLQSRSRSSKVQPFCHRSSWMYAILQSDGGQLSRSFSPCKHLCMTRCQATLQRPSFPPDYWVISSYNRTLARWQVAAAGASGAAPAPAAAPRGAAEAAHSAGRLTRRRRLSGRLVQHHTSFWTCVHYE